MKYAHELRTRIRVYGIQLTPEEHRDLLSGIINGLSWRSRWLADAILASIDPHAGCRMSDNGILMIGEDPTKSSALPLEALLRFWLRGLYDDINRMVINACGTHLMIELRGNSSIIAVYVPGTCMPIEQLSSGDKAQMDATMGLVVAITGRKIAETGDGRPALAAYASINAEKTDSGAWAFHSSHDPTTQRII